MGTRIKQVSDLAKAVGWGSTLSILSRRAGKFEKPILVTAAGHVVEIRPCDSDLFVAGQIFGAEEYSLGPYLPNLVTLARQWKSAGVVPTILDVGANVGYSALYFADKFVDAAVVAIEADDETFSVLERNVARNPRVTALHAAVWSHDKGVNFGPSPMLGSWAARVDSEVGNTRSILLKSSYESIANARPLIIKLDVEGAEKEICASSRDIISSAPCIMIEPHDFMLPGASCLSPLYEALSSRSVDTLILGENLIFIDSKLAPMQ